MRPSNLCEKHNNYSQHLITQLSWIIFLSQFIVSTIRLRHTAFCPYFSICRQPLAPNFCLPQFHLLLGQNKLPLGSLVLLWCDDVKNRSERRRGREMCSCLQTVCHISMIEKVLKPKNSANISIFRIKWLFILKPSVNLETIILCLLSHVFG